MSKKTKKQKSTLKKKPAKEKSGFRAKQATLDKTKRPTDNTGHQLSMILTGLAVVGMILTGYLVLSSWLSQPILYCEDGGACDLVQKSRWGKFLGVPTSLLGFLTYLSIAYANLRTQNRLKRWQLVWTISLIGLGYSIYLQTISLIVIESTCIYCLASLLILTAIFALATYNRPKKRSNFNFLNWAKQACVITIVIIGGMHLHYSGVFSPAAGPEDPFLKGLAQHLTQEKAVFYGAVW